MMRLNLFYTDSIQDRSRENYVNVDFSKNVDLSLDYLVDDGECDEIIAEDVLDYIYYKEIDDILKKWCAKLRVGGEIVVGGTEILAVNRALYYRYIDIEEAQSLIYRGKSLHHIVSVRNKIENLGLKICNISSVVFKFIIRARRIR